MFAQQTRLLPQPWDIRVVFGPGKKDADTIILYIKMHGGIRFECKTVSDDRQSSEDNELFCYRQISHLIEKYDDKFLLP